MKTMSIDNANLNKYPTFGKVIAVNEIPDEFLTPLLKNPEIRKLSNQLEQTARDLYVKRTIYKFG